MSKVTKLPINDEWKSITLGELKEYMETDPKAYLEVYSYKHKDGTIAQAGTVHLKDHHRSGPFEWVMSTVRAALIPARKRKSA